MTLSTDKTSAPDERGFQLQNVHWLWLSAAVIAIDQITNENQSSPFWMCAVFCVSQNLNKFFKSRIFSVHVTNDINGTGE